MDPLSKDQRHKAMSHIRSNNTSIEIKLRRALWHKGYRYRKNYKALPGSPDIAITKYKIAVFCDSEFFHGKDWAEVLQPRIKRGNNPDFWEKKISKNIKRDSEVDRLLTSRGWTVIRFWGEEINKHLEECIEIVDECAFQSRVNGWNEAHPEPSTNEYEEEVGIY